MNLPIIVQIKNVCKMYNNQPVLSNISLDLMQGDNMVIVGRSGQGKSVLLKCIIGLTSPDSGSIEVLNQNIHQVSYKDRNALKGKIGFCFQNNALYDSMTVRENLEFPLRRNSVRLSSTVIHKRVTEALDEVDLSHTAEQLPSQLSGGMRKRIGIARTLILKPEVMLYDEPTAGLDPVTSMEVNKLILTMQAKYKISSIIITHDLTCARITANQLVVMQEGKISLQGTFDALALNHTDPVLQSFFNYYSPIQ